MTESIIYWALVLLVAAWAWWLVRSSDAKKRERLRIIEGQLKEARRIEEQLKKANMPALYNKYAEFDEPVPLGLVDSRVIRQLEEPSGQGLKKFYESLLEDNDNVNKLTVFLDTGRYGTFVRTLEQNAFKDVEIDESSAHVHVKWEPIYCGKSCTVHGYIVFQDSILKYFGNDIDVRPGDIIKFSYTLNPKDVKMTPDEYQQHALHNGDNMLINEYQEGAVSTAIYPGKIVYPALGLCGELGELMEAIEDSESSKEQVMKEIGDVLWYAANVASDIGMKLSDIMDRDYFVDKDSIYIEDAVVELPVWTGKVAENAKKILRDNNGVVTPVRAANISEALKHIISLLENVSGSCRFGFTLEECAQLNYEKLTSRQERGKLRGDGDNR